MTSQRPDRALKYGAMAFLVGLSLLATHPVETAMQSSHDIFVDATAPPGGDGTSAATAYRTIRDAVADANLTINGAIIHVAEGTYIEAPDITITRDGVTLLGSTVLGYDAPGWPTGAFEHGAIIRPAVPPGTPVPAGSALIRVNASNVTIAGLVLDGGLPRPPGSIGGGQLLVVDGAPTKHSLDDISIRDNVIVNHGQAVLLRLASAVVSGNFFARSGIGLIAFGSFEQNALHPDVEGRLSVTGNRFVEHRNIGLSINGYVGSLTAPSFSSLGLADGPGVIHVEIAQNDISRNGNGPLYPQPIQYSGLLFVLTSADASDPLQPSRIDATVHDNRFVENGYGLAINQRVGLAANEAAYTLDGRFTGNTYCGNGLNDAFFNFGLNAQSHGLTSGTAFRYAMNSTYTIDAAGDGLASTAFDYDHPVTDPRLPLTSPGTLLLNNVLVFNGVEIPNGVQLSRPALLNPGPPPVFGPIDAGFTPTLSLVGPNPMLVARGDTFIDPGATALDPCEGNISGKIVTSGTVDMTTPGTYVVSYDVSNAVGKGTRTLQRTVTVLNWTPLSMGPQAMEGNLTLSPGATLGAGYDFTMPGTHPTETVSFIGANVTFGWKCVSTSGSGFLVVPMTDQSYTDAQNSSAWYPSGDQHSSLVYQGSITVPNRCNGGPLSLQAGGTFSARVLSTDTQVKVNVRWHYSGGGSAGGWSGSQSIAP